MPNHVTNIIEIVDLGGATLDQVRSLFVNNDGHVDFNIIVPKPECLDNFNPHHGIVTTAKAVLQLPPEGNSLLALMEADSREKALSKMETMSDEEKEFVDQATLNYEKCGYVYWYDWCTDKWGTKWNAYDQPSEGFPNEAMTFHFNTAWSHPGDLIEIISKRAPETTFHIKFADEDLGNNCGTYTIKNGVLTDVNIAPKGIHKEYVKLAFEIVYGDDDPRSHGLDENWEYSDEVYEAYHEEVE